MGVIATQEAQRLWDFTLDMTQNLLWFISSKFIAVIRYRAAISMSTKPRLATSVSPLASYKSKSIYNKI